MNQLATSTTPNFDGIDFIDNLADEATREGNDFHASQLRACAAQWRAERGAHQVLQTEASELQQRLNRVVKVAK